MANVLARLREIVVYTPLYIIPIFIFGIMQLPEYQSIIDSVGATLDGETIQATREMRVPVALSQILPMKAQPSTHPLTVVTGTERRV